MSIEATKKLLTDSDKARDNCEHDEADDRLFDAYAGLAVAVVAKHPDTIEMAQAILDHTNGS